METMRVLDCATRETALATVAKCVGTDQAYLRGALRALPTRCFDAEYERGYDAQHEVLWRMLVGAATPVPTPDVVHWFHATRVPPGSDFHEGLLPLGSRLATLRSFLEHLMYEKRIPPAVSQTDGGHAGHHYAVKTADPMHWGPYAVLVRDAIVRRSPITHDYLKTPEIVEDLAAILTDAGYDRLIAAYRSATRPCIVSFASREPREEVIPIALLYCYLAAWRYPPGIEGSTCFDGHGKSVPPDDLLRVEYLRGNRAARPTAVTDQSMKGKGHKARAHREQRSASHND